MWRPKDDDRRTTLIADSLLPVLRARKLKTLRRSHPQFHLMRRSRISGPLPANDTEWYAHNGKDKFGPAHVAAVDLDLSVSAGKVVDLDHGVTPPTDDTHEMSG